MAAQQVEEDFIRPLSTFEMFLEIIHQHGFMVTSYALTLNSRKPLQEYHVKRSLLHLLRKLPNLGVTIRQKNGKMWFHKMENENIDFKTLENADFLKEYEAMTRYHYNTFDGPLWCARLLPVPPYTPCEMPEVKESFPNQYYFLFGFHHAITDGTSSIRICDHFINILNDVISGKPINDREQLAEHVSDDQTAKLLGEVMLEAEANPNLLEPYKMLLAGDIKDLPFFKVFPPPQSENLATLNITRSLSAEETTAFLSRCKQGGVTIHSGFCAVINKAIVRMLNKAGVNEKLFKIKHYHTFNNRRYWSGDTSKAFGAHLGKLTILSEVSNDIKEFWKEARQFHSQLSFSINDKGPIKEALIVFMNIPPNLDIAKLMEKMPMADCYYGTTNMGNLGTTFTGEGEDVQVTDFRRTTSTTKNLCSHVMQTFRGRFIYGLDYGASYMSTETAELYVDTIFKVLREVISLR